MLLAIASKANAGEGIGHNDLHTFSHVAYHNVENSCASDVENYCVRVVEEQPPLLMMFPLFGDPFLDWIFASSATAQNVPTPPEVHDLNQFIDQMFASSFLVSSASAAAAAGEEPPSSASTTVWFHELTPQTFIDTGITRLAAEKEPEEIPQLAQQLQKYGANLLHDVEAGSERHQMARRLTEMDTKTINYHVQLPFGRKNSCLKWAFEQELVSEKCSHSILVLEHTFVYESQQEAFFAKTGTVFCFYLIFTILLTRYAHGIRQGRLRLKRKIIQAVYTNPCIRKQVELDMGESIDHGVERDDDSLVSRREKKASQNKGVLQSKNIVCEGIPLQIV